MADLCLDEDVHVAFAPFLQLHDHTTLTSQAAGRLGAHDDDQLLWATHLGRLLVTHNRKDYLLLARAWRSFARRWGVEPEQHAGIIVIPQPALLPPPRAAAEIDHLIRGERDLWGRLFDYDRRWGWVAVL